ncbi:hypothetical protein EA473_05350 [Natrarchaeobius chitinivorans]|uniref:Uncharacterized protein n=1 Tax=Natrarchaeobius chitinivorans TaxID=1679083 RepID=A0A3N6PBB3_NATCH|nr:hypothetical protein EA473_05350 [Natrarchaeobius chitinivorans]
MKIGRFPAAVAIGDGREFAIDFSLSSVRQYERGALAVTRTPRQHATKLDENCPRGVRISRSDGEPHQSGRYGVKTLGREIEIHRDEWGCGSGLDSHANIAPGARTIPFHRGGVAVQPLRSH